MYTYLILQYRLNGDLLKSFNKLVLYAQFYLRKKIVALKLIFSNFDIL